MIHARILVAALALAPALPAQSPRDAYRAAYASWRQTDPDLERDAATVSPTLLARIAKAAQQAFTFKSARSAFLRSAAQQLAESMEPVKSSAPIDVDLTGGHDLEALAAAELKTAESAIKAFDGDKDPGITRIRQALERERAALAALAEAIQQRAAASASSSATEAKADQAKAPAITAFSQFSAAILEAAEACDRESALWSKYYRSLSPAPNSAVPVGLIAVQ
jgi:hypothetical protein